MSSTTCGALVVASILSVSSAWAQEPNEVITTEIRAGDKVTITTRDDRQITGRFVGDQGDAMVLSLDGSHARFSWSDIDRVQRRRNGVLLGAILGAGAGVATGIPLAMLAENETGEGAKTLTGMIGLGLGMGIAIDGLLSTNRTLYDRRAQTRFYLLPQQKGGSVRVSLTW